MASFVVTDTSQNKSTHYEPLGGGRVALLPPAGAYIRPSLGDFVSQQKTAPMNYQVYQLSGSVTYASLAGGAKVYLDPGPLNNLDYDQSISVLSAYATILVRWDSGSDFTGLIQLMADFPYVANYTAAANQRPVLRYSPDLLEQPVGNHGQIDGTTILNDTYGPAPTTAGRLPAQPRLYLLYTAGNRTPADAAALSFVINLIVVPGAPRATDLS